MEGDRREGERSRRVRSARGVRDVGYLRVGSVETDFRLLHEFVWVGPILFWCSVSQVRLAPDEQDGDVGPTDRTNLLDPLRERDTHTFEEAESKAEKMIESEEEEVRYQSRDAFELKSERMSDAP